MLHPSKTASFVPAKTSAWFAARGAAANLERGTQGQDAPPKDGT